MNKAKQRPVSEIHEHHQIDLVDMENMVIEYEGKTCQCILSVMDTFSRFHWLVPFDDKRRSRVKKEQQKI